MSGNASNGPMLKAAGLWAKTSVKGGQYLTGRLGGLKVLIMENRDRKSDDDPSHTLFFVEAPDRRQEPQERAQERSGGSGARTHPGRLRRHQRRTVRASLGIAAAFLGIGTGCPTIRHRSTAMVRRRPEMSSTMRRSGRGERGQAKGPHHAGSREARIPAGAEAGTDRRGASRDPRARQAEEDPAPRPALHGSSAGGRTDPDNLGRCSR
jgi:hypothetical protein